MKKYFILFPVYNDWASLWKLCKEINIQIKDLNAKFSFLFVNDASTEKKPNTNLDITEIDKVKIINMKKNQLSGRSIATGLKYIAENEEFDYVIVMDSDGEDKPETIIDIFNKLIEFPDKTIVVNRFRRNENILYKLMYEVHKIITLISTGELIKFGNFICLPKNHVKKIIHEGDLWNCFPGTVAKKIKEKKSIKKDRGIRYFGPSKTSYIKLIHHSFTIISVFIKKVFLRFFLASLFYIFIIYEKISLISLMPVFFLLFFLTITFFVSFRKNTNGIKNSTNNIKEIEILK